MGCIMMRVCHLDTCPVGIATQNPQLREKFAGRAEHVVNFFQFVAQEVRELMAELGFRTVDEMIGRSDLLDMKRAIGHYKSQGLDFSKIFYRPDVGPDVAVRRIHEQDHGLDKALDQQLVPLAAPALERGEAVEIRHADPQRQPDRRHHPRQRADAQVRRRRDSRRHDPGSSSRVRRPEPRRLRAEGDHPDLEGDANDYVGKGLSGRQDHHLPPERSRRSSPRTTSSSATSPSYGATAGPALFLRAGGGTLCVATAGRPGRRRGDRRPRLRVHDRRRRRRHRRSGRNFAAG
jgi:glutamate synthase (ferredoxin)